MKSFYRTFNFLIFALTGVSVGLMLMDPSDQAVQERVEMGAAQASASPPVNTTILNLPYAGYSADMAQVLSGARESIKVYTDILLSGEVLAEIKKATESGVDVQIVLEESTTNDQFLSKWVPRHLSKASFWVVEGMEKPTFILVDESILLVSSMSLSESDRVERPVIAVATKNKSLIDTYLTDFSKSKMTAKNFRP